MLLLLKLLPFKSYDDDRKFTHSYFKKASKRNIFRKIADQEMHFVAKRLLKPLKKHNAIYY